MTAPGKFHLCLFCKKFIIYDEESVDTETGYRTLRYEGKLIGMFLPNGEKAHLVCTFDQMRKLISEEN